MKALLFLLTILFAVWLWRKNRLNTLQQRASNETKEKPGSSPAQEASALTPSPMHACLHCGVHMPAADMVKGQRGRYCSQAHCSAASDTAQ